MVIWDTIGGPKKLTPESVLSGEGANAANTVTSATAILDRGSASHGAAHPLSCPAAACTPTIEPRRIDEALIVQRGDERLGAVETVGGQLLRDYGGDVPRDRVA